MLYLLLTFKVTALILVLLRDCLITNGANLDKIGWYVTPPEHIQGPYQARFFRIHDDVIKWKIFHVTGPLGGESTVYRWIPPTKTSDAELWCFFLSAPELKVEQTIKPPVMWGAIAGHYDVTVMKCKQVFTIHIIHSLWYGMGSWHYSSSNTKTHIFYIVNIITADDLATQGARVSATMILTYVEPI